MGGFGFRTLTGWVGGKTRGTVGVVVERPGGFAHRRWMRNTIPLFAMVVLAGAVLAGCVAKPVAPVRAPARPPAARPAVVPRPVPPQGSDWRDWPVTAGDWAYRQDQGGSTALFGAGGGNAVLTLRCDSHVDGCAKPSGAADQPWPGRIAGLCRDASCRARSVAGCDRVQPRTLHRGTGRGCDAGCARLGRNRPRDRGLQALNAPSTGAAQAEENRGFRPTLQDLFRAKI
jgi:hypothetical protein